MASLTAFSLNRSTQNVIAFITFCNISCRGNNIPCELLAMELVAPSAAVLSPLFNFLSSLSLEFNLNRFVVSSFTVHKFKSSVKHPH